MNKQQIFEYINATIASEYGNPLAMDQLLTASELDSLGMTLCLLQLDTKFGLFKDKPEKQSEFDYLQIETLTVRDLVTKCVLSNIAVSTET